MLIFTLSSLPEKSLAASWLSQQRASTLFQLPKPITLSKTASVTTTKVGETITYTYYITNNSPVTLTEVTLTDDLLGEVALTTLSLSPSNVITLNPWAIATGIATYAVKESNLPGPIINQAMVKGRVTGGVVVPAFASCVVLIAKDEPLIIVKKANVVVVEVGNRITYTYWITNIGRLTLTKISLQDDKLGVIKTETNTLAVNKGITATDIYTVNQTDMPIITNTATVTGIDSRGDIVTATSTVTVNVIYGVAITMTKKANVATAKVGDVITYTYWITNIGSLTLTQISLKDDKLDVDLTETNILTVGKSITAVAIYTVSQIDRVARNIINVATVTAIALSGKLVTAVDSIKIELPMIYLPIIIKSIPIPTLAPNPQIAILKKADSSEVSLGGTIKYDYLITNTGNVTLNQVKLIDSKLGEIFVEITELGTGRSTTATASYTVKRTDLFSVTNVAIVIAKFGNQSISAVSNAIVVNIPTTQLSINNRNTGGINPLELRTDSNELVVSCVINSSDGVQYCGAFHPGTYKIMAQTKRCGKLEATRTYNAGPRTLEIYCN